MAGTSAPRSVVLTTALCCAIALCALVTAAVLRPGGSTSASGNGAPRSTAKPGSGCGDEPCRVLASTTVNGMRVELLAGSGGTGLLRAGGPSSGTTAETTITDLGVRLNHDSLRCAELATPVCLVRGPHDGGMAGELHIWRGDGWRFGERPYFSDAGAIALDDATGDRAPEVIVVRHDCGPGDSDSECRRAPVLAEVYDVRGDLVGCTVGFDSPGRLRGWPEVDLMSDEVEPCS